MECWIYVGKVWGAGGISRGGEAVEVYSCRDSRELFRITKQSVEEKKDVVGVSCLKDESGAMKVSVDDRKKIWKEHTKLMLKMNGVIELMLLR